MKKKIGISAMSVLFVTVLIVLLTVKDTGKKQRPDLGYEDSEYWDVFEEGGLYGDFEYGPINEDFLDFKDTTTDADIRLREQTSGEVNGLGLIPSPVPFEIHDGVRAKSAKDAVYEPVYDLRDPDNDGSRRDSLLPLAREQGTCGACWAFASYGAIESLLLSRMGYLSDFSEHNAMFTTGFDWTGCQGGNVDMMMAYLARGGGPIYEKDDPFTKKEDGVCSDCETVRYIDSIIKLKVRSSNSDILYIKQALLDYGPLYASMYWASEFYHASDDTYFCDTYGANHAVTLVGWDDHKSVEGADSLGAFIVRNSWGSDWGDDGYFYMSYNDKSLAFSSIVAFKDEPDILLPFDRIYYHDDLGMTSSTGFGRNQAWGACAFTPEADGDLIAVGFYTTAHDTNYEITIFEKMSDGRLTGQLAGPVIGSLTGKGYHTIRMTNALNLTEGDGFVVAVKFQTPYSYWPVPLERPFPDYSSKAYAWTGESFLSSNGLNWKDTTAYFSNTSVCIKALVREKNCSDEELAVNGPADQGIFLTPAKGGTWVKAVVTTGCGEPVTDADVIASLGADYSDLVLYDDGQHNDGIISDGIYANDIGDDDPPESSAIMVRASWNEQQTHSSGKDIEYTSDSNEGGGGGGCFMESFFSSAD